MAAKQKKIAGIMGDIGMVKIWKGGVGIGKV